MRVAYLPYKGSFPRSSRGFTLVELAVVLIVIGLLIGATLKGVELLNNARTNRVIADLYNFQASVDNFKNLYNALPGDMRNAAARIPGCSSAPCNGNGNGDFRLTSDSPFINTFYPPQSEARAFWIHLAKTGLMSNPVNVSYSGQPNRGGEDFPRVPFGGGYRAFFNSMTSSFPYVAANVIRPSRELGGGVVTLSFTGQQASQIDHKMDDGLPGTGRVFGLAGTSACTAPSSSSYPAGKNTRCNILYVIGD